MDIEDNILPLYTSFEEEKSQCVFCKTNIDDHINYGNKLNAEKITAHYYCLVRISCVRLYFEAEF